MNRALRGLGVAAAFIGIGYLITHDVLPPWLLVSGIVGAYFGGATWYFIK